MSSFIKHNKEIKKKPITFKKPGKIDYRTKQSIFGKSCRPATPMEGVIGNLYGNIAEIQKNQLYEIQKVTYHIQQKEIRFQKPKATRATQLAASQILNNTYQEFQDQIPFKMKKFKNIRPKTVIKDINILKPRFSSRDQVQEDQQSYISKEKEIVENYFKKSESLSNVRNKQFYTLDDSEAHSILKKLSK